MLDKTEEGVLRAGYRRITGLNQNNFYMVEELDKNFTSLGFWFVRRNGKLDRELIHIGRTDGEAIINLNNDHTYVVRNARAVRGFVRYFDLDDMFVPNPPSANSKAVNGKLFLRGPDIQYLISLPPDPEHPDLDYEYVTRVLVPGPGESVRILSSAEGRVIHLQMQDSYAAEDYIFFAEDAGSEMLDRFSFRVLTVIPVFGVTVTVYPVDVSGGNLPTFTPLGPLYQHELGTIYPYARFMFYNPGGAFTNIEWRDERNNLIGTTGSVLLDFTDEDVFRRYSLPGTHLFTLTATRYGAPWSAIVQLIIRLL